MAGYTIANLLEIEDSAPKFGLSPGLEARFAGQALELRNSGISYQRLAPGSRIPFGHRHKEQEELYLVVEGSGRLKLDDEIVDVRRWDAVRISKETMRGVEAGPEGLAFVAFGAPYTGPEDAELTPGWWAD